MVHIGIIPDGNRRWCAANNKNHENLLHEWLGQLAESIRDLPDSRLWGWRYLMAINEISLYICSIDNVRRSDRTMETIYEFLGEVLPVFLEWKDCINDGALRVNIIGSIDELKPEFRDMLVQIREAYTSDAPLFTITLAVAYDYETDVHNHGVFSDPNYDTRNMSQLDVVLRTGGDQRLSGFFPTKTYYAEFFFLKKFWPELELGDINKVLKRFGERSRRFGA